MKAFWPSGLRARLMLVLLCSVPPAWGLVFYNAVERKRLVVCDVQENVHRLANLAALQEEQWVEGSRQILVALAEFLRLNHDDPTECGAFFTGVLKQYKRYANFGAVRANGEVFVSAVPSPGVVTAVDREWFQRAIQTQEHVISDYHVGRITGEPVVVSAYAVRDSTGEVLAVVFAALNLKWVNEFELAVAEQMPDRSSFILVDDEGVILSHHPDPAKWRGKSLPNAELVRAILEDGTGTMEIRNPVGVPWLYAYAPVHTRLGERALYLILGLPKDLAFASANKALIRGLSWLGVVVGLALVAVWFVSDHLVLRPVSTLVKATRRLAKGDLSARTEMADGRGELGELARAFDQMAGILEQNEIERKGVEEELRSSREQLRSLNLYLQAAREEERTRIAQEIHDELGQELTALKMDLASLRRHLDKDKKSAIEKVESMSKLVDMTIRDVQRISTELRPGVLDDLGLPSATEWQCEEFQKRTGIPCEVALSDESFVLDADRSTAFFRILQETLTNVIRHANATKVHVWLERGEAETVLEVKDNGVGITEGQISDPRALGLIGMRERVRALRGEFTISGAPAKGTSVRVRIPDARETADDKDRHSG